MSVVQLTALVSAIAGVIGAIVALIAQLRHNGNPNAHK